MRKTLACIKIVRIHCNVKFRKEMKFKQEIIGNSLNFLKIYSTSTKNHFLKVISSALYQVLSENVTIKNLFICPNSIICCQCLDLWCFGMFVHGLFVHVLLVYLLKVTVIIGVVFLLMVSLNVHL